MPIDVVEKEKLLLWIKWIRNKADWFDLLVSEGDEILGKKYDIHNILKDIDISESNDKKCFKNSK